MNIPASILFLHLESPKLRILLCFRIFPSTQDPSCSGDSVLSCLANSVHESFTLSKAFFTLPRTHLALSLWYGSRSSNNVAFYSDKLI